MLTTLFLMLALAVTPPSPPGFHEKTATPKAAEQKQSWGQPMVRQLPPAPFLPEVELVSSQGFLITNIIVGGDSKVTIQWSSGSAPFLIEGTPDLMLGPWNTVLDRPTMVHSATFQLNQNHFWRVLQNQPIPFSITHTNPQTLEWQAPILDMSDSLSSFKIQRQSLLVSAPPPPILPVGDPNYDTGWTDCDAPIPSISPCPIPVDPTKGTTVSPYTTQDSQIPGANEVLYYRPKEITANGVRVPYNYVKAGGQGSAPGSVKNAFQFGDAGIDAGNTIVVDASGNIFIGRDYRPNLGQVSAGLIQKLGPDGTVKWSVDLTHSGQNQGCSIVALCLDASGNIYGTGWFSGTISLNGKTVTVASAAATDVYVFKLQDNGTSATCQWIVSGNAANNASGLAKSQSGYGIVAYDTWIAIIGTFTKPSINFGTLLSTTGQDAFFLKLKQIDGTELWSHALGGTSGFNMQVGNGVPGGGVAVSLTTNPGELAFVGTVLGGPFDFGNGHTDSAFNISPFIVRYDTSNNYVSHRIITIANDATLLSSGRGVVFDSNGNMCFTGSWNGQADFGAGGTLPSSATDNIFIVSYARDCSHNWHSVCNRGSAQETAYSICFDPSLNVVSIIGQIGNSPTFTGATTPITTDGLNAFIANWDILGNYKWGEAFLPRDTSGNCIAVNAIGLYGIGKFFTTITLGANTFTSRGNYDVWVAQISK